MKIVIPQAPADRLFSEATTFLRGWGLIPHIEPDGTLVGYTAEAYAERIAQTVRRHDQASANVVALRPRSDAHA